MGEAVVDQQEVELERKQIEDIDYCLNALDKLQTIFLSGPGIARKNDLVQASGRKCVLGVSGLKYHRYQKFFEVSQNGVKIVPPYEKFNTYISAPADSILRVLKGILNGDTSAFSSEWARGKAKIVGERNLHDGYVFSEVFKHLAEVIRRYRGK